MALRPRLAHHRHLRPGRRRGHGDGAARRPGRALGRRASATRCTHARHARGLRDDVQGAAPRACRGQRDPRRAAGGRRASRARAARCPAGAWVQALSRRAVVDELLGDPDRWRLLDNTFKPYPCGIVSHPGIEAAERLAPRLPDAAIERVELRCHPLVSELTGNPQPADGLQARFSTIHGVAAGLLDGEVTLAQYADARVREPEIVALRGRTTLVARRDCARDAAELRVVAGGEELVERRRARPRLARAPARLGRPAREGRPPRLRPLGPDGAAALERAVRELAAAPSLAGRAGGGGAGAPRPSARHRAPRTARRPPSGAGDRGAGGLRRDRRPARVRAGRRGRLGGGAGRRAAPTPRPPASVAAAALAAVDPGRAAPASSRPPSRSGRRSSGGSPPRSRP